MSFEFKGADLADPSDRKDFMDVYEIVSATKAQGDSLNDYAAEGMYKPWVQEHPEEAVDFLEDLINSEDASVRALACAVAPDWLPEHPDLVADAFQGALERPGSDQRNILSLTKDLLTDAEPFDDHRNSLGLRRVA